MKKTQKVFKAVPVILFFLSIMTAPEIAPAQETLMATAARDTLIAIARDMMAAARYCALITLDSTGQPHARTMEPFPPEDDMTVWLGTNPKSRKVQEIRNDPRVTLYYADPKRGGYITITGTAILVNDAGEKAKRWKESWASFYPDREKNYILIKVTPRTLDVLSYTKGITGDKVTWRTPSVKFKVLEEKNMKHH